MSLMSLVEIALWAILGFVFWAGKLQLRFPAMAAYLTLRVFSAPVMAILLYGQQRHWFNDYCFVFYFYFYWAVYIVSAVLLFFVCIEVFRSALSAFSGLQKLGTIVFRWAALISAIVSLSTLTFEPVHIYIVSAIAFRLMRCVCILELCLLGFLCLSMNALRLSVRDMAFGIALGFGLMSTNDFIIGSLLSRSTSLNEPLQFVYESVTLALLCIWIVYAALPEPERKPLMMTVNSTILRWNEIASVLGHTGTQVAVRPTSGFLLADAERAVESSIDRQLANRDSEP
jgi:hypothetical protein